MEESTIEKTKIEKKTRRRSDANLGEMEIPEMSKLKLNDFDEETPSTVSSNLSTLKNGETKIKGLEFMRVYFSNLVKMKPELSKVYFDKSTLVLNGKTLFGTDFILMALSSLRKILFYNIQEIHTQPMLGNGIFIVVKGISTDSKFHISLNIITLRKKFRILNQFMDIIPNVKSL